ncbi:MAG TPA: YdeI/OmpD-associated family protein [Gemmatimonadales bacterium]|nr:YdeI/OmpD-associated family protein [Gemmatimonadales bacterium]
MGTRDPRVSAYIRDAAPFARPILTHIRKVVHTACPDVEETVKWGMPMFTHHGILCFMAGFKQHVGLGFWKGGQVVGASDDKTGSAMGQFGRLTEVGQLPSQRVLTRYVRTAMRINESGERKPVKKAARQPKPAPQTPADLRAAIERSAKAKAAWAHASPSHRREYTDWIAEAKRPETRARRIATTVEWLTEGKSRNWKYEKRPGP